MNNNRTTLFVMCALLAILLISTLTYAETRPIHLDVLDGKVVNLSGPQCREVLFGIFDIHSRTIPNPRHNNLDGIDEPETLTTPSIDPYSFHIAEPFERLKWIKFDDIKIESLSIGNCTIRRDIHGYGIEVYGLDASISTNFSYLFEPGMPVMSDKGHLLSSVRNSTILARLDLLDDDTQFNSMESFLDRYDEEKHHDTEDNSDDQDWNAEVVTFIPTMENTVTESPYSSIYNTLLKQHDVEIRFLVSLLANSQIERMLEEYCNEIHEGKRQCDHEKFMLENVASVLDEVVKHSDDELNYNYSPHHDHLEPTNVIPSQ